MRGRKGHGSCPTGTGPAGVVAVHPASRCAGASAGTRRSAWRVVCSVWFGFGIWEVAWCRGTEAPVSAPSTDWPRLSQPAPCLLHAGSGRARGGLPGGSLRSLSEEAGAEAPAGGREGAGRCGAAASSSLGSRSDDGKPSGTDVHPQLPGRPCGAWGARKGDFLAVPGPRAACCPHCRGQRAPRRPTPADNVHPFGRSSS